MTCRFTLIFWVTIGFISNLHATPIKCPSTASIKAQRLTSVDIVAPNFYIIYANNQYDTPQNWLFAIGPIKAHSQDSAMDIATEYLQDMSGNPEPNENRDAGYFSCEYHVNHQDFIAFAFLGIEPSDILFEQMKVKLKNLNPL